MIIFPDCIIIHYSHNHIIKLVKFSQRGGGGGGGFPLLPSALFVPVPLSLNMSGYQSLVVPYARSKSISAGNTSPNGCCTTRYTNSTTECWLCSSAFGSSWQLLQQWINQPQFHNRLQSLWVIIVDVYFLYTLPSFPFVRVVYANFVST
jgi:hypothetical protein